MVQKRAYQTGLEYLLSFLVNNATTIINKIKIKEISGQRDSDKISFIIGGGIINSAIFDNKMVMQVEIKEINPPECKACMAGAY